MDRYVTQNLWESAYLLTKGYKLVGKDSDNGYSPGCSRIKITFEGEGIEEEAVRFYNRAKVEAKKFSDNYRTIKDYIFTR